jgi:hypothetical protein
MKAITTSTTFASLALSLLAAGCIGDNEVPPADDQDPDQADIVKDHEKPDHSIELPRAATCADILAADPAATDGDYTLYIGGDKEKPWQAYCADMASTPKEYLPLVFVLGDHNFSQYTAGGASPGSSVRTSFLRLRIDPATLAIDIGDQTFATSTGQLSHSFGEAVTSMPFGVAMSCDGSASGLGDIDLRGTPFKIASHFVSVGTGGNGAATMDSAQQQVSLTGGGFCGWTGAEGAPFNPFNAAHSSVLVLTYSL